MTHEIKTIHLWFPGCHSSDGGVQTYSGFVARAMREILPEAKIQIFSKNDRRMPPNAPNGRTSAHCSGAWPRRVRTIAFSTNLASAATIHRPDLILSTLVNFAPLARMLNQKLNIPYWLVAHGVDVWGRTDTKLTNAMRNAQQILCVSSYTRNRLLEEQQLAPGNLALQPNTFDHDRFQIAPKPAKLLQRYSLRPEQPVMMTVARLSTSEQYKGYDRVIEALPAIIRFVPDVHYLIVGKGDDTDRIRAMIQEKKLQNHVTLTGFVPDDELPAHYNLCDLFIMPSKGEGFGIVFLEALASGKPVIAGNSDGSVDPLRNGELGVLLNPDDVRAIADECVGILQKKHRNPLLRQPNELRRRVIEAFGFPAFQKQLKENLARQFHLEHAPV